MNRFANALFALCFAAGLTACGGGGYSGFVIPIESELKPWVAPEADQLVSDDAEGAAAEEDYEDYEDYEDEEEADVDDGAAAPAATEATPGAAEPVVK